MGHGSGGALRPRRGTHRSEGRHHPLRSPCARKPGAPDRRARSERSSGLPFRIPSRASRCPLRPAKGDGAARPSMSARPSPWVASCHAPPGINECRRDSRCDSPAWLDVYCRMPVCAADRGGLLLRARARRTHRSRGAARARLARGGRDPGVRDLGGGAHGRACYEALARHGCRTWSYGKQPVVRARAASSPATDVVGLGGTEGSRR